MATLVLTAVGSAVGGPIGGALGAVAGQWIDGATWAAPRRREGPRLSELRVQTSSYGTPIAALFGTVRVAVTVIWASDLIEQRGVSRAAKGAPAAVQYSYAASFAVLLSARAIRGVRRIWADGSLIRGAAGDMKTAGALRIHLGGEDQPPDPLVASAEGAQAPAHRGCAYAVFEGLALGEFGNRIPSLSFEVVADEAPVSVRNVAAALAPVSPGGAGSVTLDGFAAGGGSVGAVLSMLAQAGDGWFAADGARLAMGDGTRAAGRTIADAGVAAEGVRRAARGRAVAPLSGVPRVLTIGHYDPARDYQAGVQAATRPGSDMGADGGRMRVEMPAVLSAGAAKGMAEAMLLRAEAERTRRTVSLGMEGLTLAPGEVVAVKGEAGRWRVDAVSVERWGTAATLVPLAAGAVLAERASGGRVMGAPDRVAGATVLRVAELPPLDDALLSAPRLTVMAAGEDAGWRGAALLVSTDDGASWQEAGATALSATLGVVEAAAGAAPATLVDRRHAVVVRLAHGGMALGDADAAALDRGANLAMVGGELIQFGRAVPLGGTRWRLEELWRGRRGTEGAIGMGRAGDGFALVEAEALRAIDLPMSAIGSRVRVMAVAPGGAAVEAAVRVTGASVAPPAPVGLSLDRNAEGGATLRWTRRSRQGWRWIDGVDAPVSEEREAYRVSVEGAMPWSAEVDAPAAAIPAAAMAGAVRVTVRQRGTLAESLPATIGITEEDA